MRRHYQLRFIYSSAGLAKQVARTWSKLPLMMLSVRVEYFRLGPREVFIWVHSDIFILRVLGRPGCEAFGPFALVMQDKRLSLGNNIEVGQTIHCLPAYDQQRMALCPRPFTIEPFLLFRPHQHAAASDMVLLPLV
jgi:hypothetical protein